MSATQTLIDWITGPLGWDTRQELGYPTVPGPYIPDEPDRLLIVTRAGGLGYTTEEPATDATSFQVRLRTTPDDVIAAETAAEQLDAAILGASFPVTVDGVVIAKVYRAGAGPTPLPYDQTDRRFELTCNYVAVMGV